MKTISLNIYTYDELTADAQAKAREWWLSGAEIDLDAARDNLIELLTLIGWRDPVIGWRDLDGAARAWISGSWRYRADWRSALDQYFGVTVEPGQEFVGAGMPGSIPDYLIPWYVAGARFDQAVQFVRDNPIAQPADPESLHFDVSIRGEGSQIAYYIGDQSHDLMMYGATSRLSQGCHAAARYIASSLQVEYDYQISTSQIEESIIANDYEFTADGTRYVTN